jgi:hypothetical protein
MRTITDQHAAKKRKLIERLGRFIIIEPGPHKQQDRACSSARPFAPETETASHGTRVLLACTTLYSTGAMQRLFRPIADRLVWNAGQLVNSVRFASKDPVAQCSGVMVAASAHKLA